MTDNSSYTNAYKAPGSATYSGIRSEDMGMT